MPCEGRGRWSARRRGWRRVSWPRLELWLRAAAGRRIIPPAEHSASLPCPRVEEAVGPQVPLPPVAAGEQTWGRIEHCPEPTCAETNETVETPCPPVDVVRP